MDQTSGTKRRIATPTAIEPATLPEKAKAKPKTKSSRAAIVPVSASQPAKVEKTATLPEAGEEVQEWTNRRASAQATRAANARQVSGRRRFVDPTTCERDYSIAEMEFMQAMQDYKLSSGRMFPTWSEVLEVLKALGYEKSDIGALPAEVPITRAAQMA